MSSEPKPLSIEDRLAIHELLARHGHIMDERQFSRIQELFTEDAVYDLADFGGGVHSGIEELRALCSGSVDRNPLAHHVTNVVITQDVDGTVRIVSKGLGVLADGRVGSVMYQDVVAKTPEGWRISHRIVVKRR